ncbi:SDR family oxidoreductase [Aneurinibacillus sp. Ricciae_BoGa-3]|uniref:SDR family oxidoreductase n=1 Tax=Aneurinibacillus sp. Ricciae_BoGa-3 TaxID=3022697 RepID=UPI002340E010|nr:SDR family oxidoreductase [Aneurinibacillus sp. Ricciae_BoGa-3]WCK56828.1 SDR family oxidoreductase [Aneurinibacillus sp. Ricciae_BoGa-3]
MHINQLFDLKGKTAIVTGGGRGLGEQIASALSEAGANVVVCSRKIDACVEVSERLKENGVRTMALSLDVSNPDDIQRVVDTTMNEFGRIDILFNNSGTSWGTPSFEMPLDKWNMVMNVNATGTFLMCQAVGRIMKEQGGGKIINIASVAGLGGVDERVMDAVGYHASKGAVIALTKDLAVKWAKHNIHVNAIAPGFFPTKMTKGVLAMGQNHILDQIPIGRYGSDSELKGAALFLASPASNFVVGHVLVVDGGTNAM